LPFEIIKPGTHYDFIGKWRVCVTISAALVLMGIAGIPVRGFRLGIDFAGGTEVQVRFVDAERVDEGDIREVVNGLGIPNASVTRFGGVDSQEFLIKFRGGREIEEAAPAETESNPAPEQTEEAAAAEEESGGAPEQVEGKETGAETVTRGGVPDAVPEKDRIFLLEETLEERIGPLEVQRVEFVGPKVGAELREDGLKAIAIACVLILIYIGFRFSVRFAPGAVVALIHDLSITASVWILLGLEFDLRVLAALLAIIGYSLNDTIIVYDRIRENMELRTKYDLKEVLNLSVNQTLSRTLLTSLTTLAAVLSLLVLGGEVIRPFAMAMTIGILVGTYSSIYIASPSLLWLETRFGAVSSGPGTGAREVAKAPKAPGEAPRAPKGEAPKAPKARKTSKKAKAGSRRRRRPS
jgi:preprotein translocase subunit SecF